MFIGNKQFFSEINHSFCKLLSKYGRSYKHKYSTFSRPKEIAKHWRIESSTYHKKKRRIRIDPPCTIWDPLVEASQIVFESTEYIMSPEQIQINEMKTSMEKN